MTTDDSAPPVDQEAQPARPHSEQRRRLALRSLVEEMMSQIRAAAGQQDTWSPTDRARALSDLERIMAQVRREATSAGAEAQKIETD